MPFPQNTSDQIFNRIRDRLAADGRFNSLSLTSTTRMLAEIVAAEIAFAHRGLIQALEQTQISKATGANLDSLGELVGVVRRSSSRAIDTTNTNFKFFVDPAIGLNIVGLIAQKMPQAIISDNPTTLNNKWIIIKSGMIVSDFGGGKIYRTTEDAVLTDREVFVPVIADGIGSAYNVGVGELSKWDNTLQGEMNNIRAFILCSNSAGITSGRSVESDNSLRSRIVNAVPSNARANHTSIRSSAFSVPGVRNATVLPNVKGPGTFQVNISSTSPIVSTGLMNAVRQAVQSSAAVGEIAFVDRPTYLGVEMKVAILFTDKATEKDRILREVRDNIVSYINNVPSGESIIINEVRERIQASSEAILDHIIVSFGIGTFNPNTSVNELVHNVSIVNQRSDTDEQFYTNATLIKVCS